MGAALKVSMVVDFEAVMMDLRRHGFTQRAVAQQIDANESTVKSYAYGVTPSFDIGERLIRFWCNSTNKNLEQLPRKPEELSVRSVQRW